MQDRIYRIQRAPEFRIWFESQTEKAKVQIDDERLSKIQDEGYFDKNGQDKDIRKAKSLFKKYTL